jgi:hypothetical protein
VIYLRATTTPAAAPGGLVWDNPDSVVAVEHDLAAELLKIAGQFSEVHDAAQAHSASEAKPKPKRATITPVHE